MGIESAGRGPNSSAGDSGTFRFGDFEVDPASGELRLGGKIIALQQQPLQVLLALVAAHGQVVTRDQLRECLWPGDIYVDFEHGLNTAIRRLREALGDRAGVPRFIETLPRRGYRFVASVERAAGDGQRRKAVAVLPFLNLTPESENSYFADGLTEDLITELSRVAALKVVSRTSVMQFRERDQNIREVAAALHADMVVEGSVRRAGDRVRIAARLIDARTDEQVWADTYDREMNDIFAIQQEVALQVAGSIAPGLSADERAKIGRPGTADVEAYRLYLQGRHCLFHFTEQGIRQGIEYFDRAAARDPHYALPHAGSAFAYMVLGIGHGAGDIPQREAQIRSRQAIDRALAIDPALGQAHGVDACLKFMVDFDWPAAERAFRTAIELGPDSAETFDTYGLFLSSLERYDEALAAQRRAHDLDPLAPVVMSDIATTLLRAGRFHEAREQAQALLRLEPSFPLAHSTLGWACINIGMCEEGLHSLEQAVALSPGNTLLLAQLGQAYAMAGSPERARQILADLTTLTGERYVSPYHLAYIHTGLGNADTAIDCLEQAVEERAGGVYGIRGSFLFATLRAHPRFVELIGRMGRGAEKRG